MAPLAHTLALLAMTVATAHIEVLPLDMAQNSFDDQYLNCGPNMTKALLALKISDFQQNSLFAKVWAEATAEWQKRGSRVSPLATPDQAIALMAYTMYNEGLYDKFNAATREAGSSRQKYQDKFHYKTLHFLLTQALATLRVDQGQNCRDVIWGVRDVQFQARRGDIIRFGQFVFIWSAERVNYSSETDTVFEVHTCHSVDIHEYSYYPGEEEVLIPPFETFEAIDVSPNGARIHLRSTGTHSNYNCEWLGGDITEGTTWGDTDTDYGDRDTRGGSVPMVPFHLGGLLLTTTALAVATGIL